MLDEDGPWTHGARRGILHIHSKVGRIGLSIPWFLSNHAGYFGTFAVSKGRALRTHTIEFRKWIVLQIDREAGDIVTNHEDLLRCVCASLRIDNSRSIHAKRNICELESPVRLKSGDWDRSVGHR